MEKDSNELRRELASANQSHTGSAARDDKHIQETIESLVNKLEGGISRQEEHSSQGQQTATILTEQRLSEMSSKLEQSLKESMEQLQKETEMIRSDPRLPTVESAVRDLRQLVSSQEANASSATREAVPKGTATGIEAPSTPIKDPWHNAALNAGLSPTPNQRTPAAAAAEHQPGQASTAPAQTCVAPSDQNAPGGSPPHQPPQPPGGQPPGGWFPPEWSTGWGVKSLRPSARRRRGTARGPTWW